MADESVCEATGKPRWLSYLENNLLDDVDVDNDQRAILAVFRVMLEAPAGDASAVASTSQKIVQYYHGEFLGNSEQVQSWTDRGVMVYINEVAGLALELAAEVLFPGPEHDKLARFFIAIRDAGPQAFGIKEQDPSFELYDTAVGTAVEEYWNRCQVPNRETDADFKTRCEESISIAALFAKFLEADMLTPRIIQFAAILLGEALGTAGDKGWKPTTQLGKWCQVAIAMPYILISGEAVAHQVRSPAAKPLVYPCGREDWKAWIAAFQRLAETLPEEAEWGLKEDAKKACEKMQVLLPESAIE
ncbi:hypothetical protein OCS_00611 [Ophiocordyceps sinensis CO18]|uniref:Uncharacterized protein n=1 Tax=Ophiocordyceps sinensis (strain Co18 / CGMCC 3.14243) TaxID=911162 RepID=T5AE20_OPHSC|nr:hypothetical protein OCS_00611 [Ophiocordyceps sinensis CO18]